MRKPGVAPDGKVLMAPHTSARKQLLLARARFMRHHPTYSEALLWSPIRARRLGVQLRRQQVIGRHIVDFLARKASLVVEVDGDALHAQHLAADTRRDEKLPCAGYWVLRIPASVVEQVKMLRERSSLWTVRCRFETPVYCE